MPKSRGAWVALTAFVAIVLSGFAWFLVVSPQLDATAAVEKERTTLATSNDVLATKVAALKAEFAKMDDYRAELAKLQVSLPTVASRDDVFDLLTELAEDAEVSIDTQTAEEAVSLLGDIRENAEEKAREEAKATPTPTATPTDGSTPTPVAPEGWAAPTTEDLVAVPVTLDLSGTYESLRDFIDTVQENPERYLLVSSPKIEVSADDDEADKLKVQLTLYTFVFTDDEGLLASLDGETEPEAPADAPVSKDSPFGTR